MVDDAIAAVYEYRDHARTRARLVELTNCGSPMNQNERLITTFYQAFQRRDSEAMAACYRPAIRFSDPVFQELNGPEVGAMWHMLCEQGTDLVVEFSEVRADDDTGTAHWDATYTFGPTGRVVHNRIDASFEFEDGRIVNHVDSFDLWRWSRMALGFSGSLTGWSGPTKSKIRRTADRSLRRFVDTHPEYQSGTSS